MKYSKEILPNGLTVLKVPSGDAESVVVDFFVKTGSRSESPRENGISHFLEHFLFKGTKKYPSAQALSERVDAIGGEMNANTGKEHTQFYIKAARQHLPMIFEILTDMIQAPLLDAEELEREKGVIVEEINMYKDTPTAEIYNILEGTMWPGDPLGRDIAGTKKTVTQFTKAMFQDYITRHYQLPNMILGVGGKYDERQLDHLIAKYWRGRPRSKFDGWRRARDQQDRPRVNIAYKKTEQTHLAMGFKSLPHDHPKNYALAVLAAILGGGMSSRLFTEVRERRGLAYYVRAGSDHYQDTGNFFVSAGVKVNKVEEALSVIGGQLQKIKSQKAPAKELAKAKEYIKGRTTLVLEDNQSRLDWYLEETAFQKKTLSPKESFKLIDKVTAADVQAVARRILDRSKMTLAVIGPYRGKNGKFLRLLKT